SEDDFPEFDVGTIENRILVVIPYPCSSIILLGRYPHIVRSAVFFNSIQYQSCYPHVTGCCYLITSCWIGMPCGSPEEFSSFPHINKKAQGGILIAECIVNAADPVGSDRSKIFGNICC